MNQAVKMLKALKSRKKVSVEQAITVFGIYTPANAVFQLREYGWKIRTQHQRRPFNTQYVLLGSA